MRISDWSSDVCSSDLKTQNYALSIAATTAHGLFSNPFSVMPPTSAAKTHRAATPHSGPADARRGAQVRNPRFQLPADRIDTPRQCWLDQEPGPACNFQPQGTASRRRLTRPPGPKTKAEE